MLGGWWWTDLHWLPVEARIQFKLLTIVFKCLHGTGPHYLTELLCRRTTRPGLRSANALQLTVPKTKSRAERSNADRAFSIAGPKLWNQLPVVIKNSSSLDVFKSRLKTFYFKKFYWTFSIFIFIFFTSCKQCLWIFFRYGHYKNFIIIIIIIINHNHYTLSSWSNVTGA